LRYLEAFSINYQYCKSIYLVDYYICTMLFDSLIAARTNRPSESGHIVSITKAVSWRIVGTIDTWIISFWVTGKWEFAFSIASIEVFTKIVLYYFHERAWEKIKDRATIKDKVEA